MSRAPAITAWALSACMALALAGTVYRMPIQVDGAHLEDGTGDDSGAAYVFVY